MTYQHATNLHATVLERPTTFRFGPTGQQCCGTIRPAGSQHASLPRVPVLLCQPYGQEAIRTQRLFRALGDRLAAKGHPVMRFDYFGTGDSDGDDTDGCMSTWVDNIVTAHEALQAWSGQSVAIWVGLRLGATLAAKASSQTPKPPTKLVLWDPIHDGPSYLQELFESSDRNMNDSLAQTWRHVKPMLERAEGPGPVQASGFELSETLESEMKAIDVTAFSGVRARQITLLKPPAHEQTHPVTMVLLSNGFLCKEVATNEHIDWASDEAMGTAIVPSGLMTQLLAEMDSVRA